MKSSNIYSNGKQEIIEETCYFKVNNELRKSQEATTTQKREKSGDV
jgi:hypothetical protein